MPLPTIQLNKDQIDLAVSVGMPPGFLSVALAASPTEGIPVVAIGDGITDDTSAFAAASAQAVRFGRAVTVPPGLYRITANVTIAAPIVFQPGARLVVSAGATVTLGDAVVAPLTRIFDCSANYTTAVIAFSKKQPVYPEWWGAVDDGGTQDSTAMIQAAITARTGCVIITGRFGISAPLTGLGGGGANGGQQLRGLSMQTSQIIVRGGFAGTKAILVDGGPNAVISDLKIEGDVGVHGIQIETDQVHLMNVFVRGCNYGVYVTRGNIMRWWNVYAESCVDGFHLECGAGTDDINGGILLGLRSYAHTGWGFWQEKGAGATGPSFNTVDVSAETGANGIHIRDGLYGKYTVYVEGMTGDDFDMTGPHEYDIRNPDNDATAMPDAGIGTNGTGSVLYAKPGPIGTWTPVLVSIGGADPASCTYTAQEGRYTKLGRMVFATFQMTVNAIDKTGVGGTVAIGGLPYEAVDGRDHSVLYFDGINAALADMIAESRAGADKKFYVLGTAAGGAVTRAALSWSQIINGTTLMGTLIYQTDR